MFFKRKIKKFQEDITLNHDAYIRRTYRKYDNALNMYAARIFRTVAAADEVLGYETDEHLRVPPAKEVMHKMNAGDVWGHEYGNIWLHTEITVPEDADGRIFGLIPDTTFREILCFLNGKPAGIINSKNHFIGGEHSVMFISADAKAGDVCAIDLECYAGHTCLGTGPNDSYGCDESKIEDPHQTYQGLHFVIMDTLMRDFVFDLSTVRQIADLPGDNFASMRAHECLMAAFPYFIGDVYSASEDEIRSSCEKIREIIAPALKKHESGEYFRGKVGIIGHSHMDTAWLWPVSETIRKCARTYSETLTLMDMYPDYTFIQSSALHLDWMRRYYPDIFDGIKKKVAEGRYEPNGGVWVECDCNITGGESMVRQFLYGQRFTEKYFGYRSDSFWLPDTFGYNGAIPQIMKGAGVKYFYTTKMTWSDLNAFPADSFVWRGIDGSEVITHLNRMHLLPDVKTLNGVISEIRDKHSSNQRLAAYGFGDGGGGPTWGALEYAKRIENLDGIPEVGSTTISGFMQDLEKRRDKLPLYDGELYLELHRGTLTQMHEVKKNNRRAEIALHNMELFNVLSGKETNEKHDELYKTLLKNQFHDILPGTCIPKVYETAIPEMHELIAKADAETSAYARSISADQKETVSVFNTLSFDRTDAFVLDGAYGIADAVSQVYTDADGMSKTAVKLPSPIPAMEAAVCTVTAPSNAPSVFKADGRKLITPFYTVVFDEDGYIASLTDRRAGREVANVNGAPLGTLWVGEDMPTTYDNWEIEDDVFKKMKPAHAVRSEAVSDGAVEYRIRSAYKIGRGSEAVVDTVFYADDPRIDYEMKLSWSERHTLLKAGFDVNIRSAFIKNEIQFGSIDRPTTRNNSIEAAKFEVCNHKWSDLSENRYGVAILNDCKYGISCEGSDIRLSLHKGGCRPDPFTDNGVHTMVYSLLPHTGAFSAESVVRPAYELNYKPVISSGILNAPKLFSVSAPNIICEAVKNAEDVENAFVLRFYECERNNTNCTVSIPNAVRVYTANLLEEKQEELEIENGSVSLNFHPFEIKTLLIEK